MSSRPEVRVGSAAVTFLLAIIALVLLAAPTRAAETCGSAALTLEDLNTLDGAGSLGKAIIRGRPYASVDDLVKKRVLRRTSFEKIKDQVTVQ